MTTTIADEIVIAIGSADITNPALHVGVEFAHLTGLPLRLIHVACDGEQIDVDLLDDHLQSTAPEVSVHIASVSADDVVSGIVGELTPRSLVILKSTNASRWSGKASVAEHVLDAFSGLVVMVGPELRASNEADALTGPILLALDGSLEAERAMPIAAELARKSNAAIVSTRVLPTSTDDATSSSAADYLATATGSIANARSVLPVSNDPIAAILDTAGAEDVALIVLSSHGDRASERSTISRTSMGLVHGATVPVLMVGPDAV